MKAKFYICEHCGNLVTTIHNAGVPLVCCGEKMKELLPNTVEDDGYG
jgi:superoxide reductase